MRIGLVGGGSGGHFYPLMAVADALRATPVAPELLYFGPEPYDKEQLATHNIRFEFCPAGKLRRYLSVQNFFDIFRSGFGIFVAIYKLYVWYPDVIFSKGGYTSVPILIAARFLRIPVVIHESDAVPGRANRLMRHYARYIAIAYDDAVQFFPAEKTALVGIPLRPELLNIPPDPFGVLNIPSDLPLIYITGGSLGAERINNLILRTLAELLPQYRIVHQTGTAHIDEIRLAAQSLIPDTTLLDRYYLQSLLPAASVSALLAAASVVITRAGSTTLFEIAHHQKPSIVIPIPEDVSHDQRSNAYAYARTGAATVLEEHNLTPHLLIQEIHSIMNDATRAAEMRAASSHFFIPDAAPKLANILISIGTEHGS